ncbi:hypothetical protein FHS06_002810 [Microbacterium halimionae]|nr:hypothetical protein [Microbacterium halimionae]
MVIDCGTCTLLGPEGPDDFFGSQLTSGPFFAAGNGWRERYRPYFENYTVDASILETIFGSFHKDDLYRSLVNFI